MVLLSDWRWLMLLGSITNVSTSPLHLLSMFHKFSEKENLHGACLFKKTAFKSDYIKPFRTNNTAIKISVYQGIGHDNPNYLCFWKSGNPGAGNSNIPRDGGFLACRNSKMGKGQANAFNCTQGKRHMESKIWVSVIAQKSSVY